VRTYNAAAWRFWCLRLGLNFPDVQLLEEAEFLVPPLRLLDDEGHHHHRQTQRRLAIAEREEELMRQ
jgi:hypothetical protein